MIDINLTGLAAVQAYCSRTACRHAMLLNFFQASGDPVCTNNVVKICASQPPQAGLAAAQQCCRHALHAAMPRHALLVVCLQACSEVPCEARGKLVVLERGSWDWLRRNATYCAYT